MNYNYLFQGFFILITGLVIGFYSPYDTLPSEYAKWQMTIPQQDDTKNILDIAIVVVRNLSNLPEIKARFRVLLEAVAADSQVENLQVALLTPHVTMELTGNVNEILEAIDDINNQVDNRAKHNDYIFDKMIQLKWRRNTEKMVIWAHGGGSEFTMEPISEVAREIGIEIHCVTDGAVGPYSMSILEKIARRTKGTIVSVPETKLLLEKILHNNLSQIERMKRAKQLYTKFLVSGELSKQLIDECSVDLFCQLERVLEWQQQDDYGKYWTTDELIRVLQALQTSHLDMCSNFKILCIPRQLETRTPVGLIEIETDHMIPITSVSTRTTILGRQATSQVTQTFRTGPETATNASWNSKFVFPLHESSSVTGFEISYGGTTLTGQVEKIDTAQRTFDAAKKSGKSAALLLHGDDSTMAKTFSMAVGNLPTDTDVQISVTVIQTLLVHENYLGNQNRELFTFIMPAMLLPDFYSAKKPTIMESHPEQPDLNHEIEIVNIPGKKLISLSSPTHNSAPLIHSRKGFIKYATKDVALQKRDFHLHLQFEKSVEDPSEYLIRIENNPVLVASQVHKGSAIQFEFPLHFQSPEDWQQSSGRNIVVALDISQSMSPIFQSLCEKIIYLMGELHTRTLEYPVEFTFCTFSTFTECWYLGPLGEEIVEKVKKYISFIQPAGGSSISRLMEKLRVHVRSPSDIILITDGDFTDTKVYRDNIYYSESGQHPDLIHRFFPIVAGFSVVEDLITEITTLSGGRIEISDSFVPQTISQHDTNANDLNYSISRQLDAIFQIPIDKVVIQWHLNNVENAGLVQAQQEIESQQTSVFSGDTMTIQRILPSYEEEPLSGNDIVVSVSAFNKERKIFHKILQVDLSTIPLNAQCRIGKYGPLCSTGPDFQLTLRQHIASTLIHKFQKARSSHWIWIESLGLEYSLASSRTAFIAVNREPIISSHFETEENLNYYDSSDANFTSISFILSFVLFLLTSYAFFRN